MTTNMLKPNDSKTEVIVITLSHHPNDINIKRIEIADQKKNRNIGVVFDENLRMNAHATAVAKSCMIDLINISRMRQYIDQFSCITLVHALISFRLDYSNSLFYVLPNGQIDRLHATQNIAAYTIVKRQKYDHITPALRLYIGFVLNKASCLNCQCQHSKRYVVKPQYTYRSF